MSIVLITGCSSGFGLEAALAFARRGDRVYATMRNLAKRDALDTAAAKEGLDIAVVQLDVTDDESVASGVGEVLDAEGRIDVLVNNAGVGFNYAVETLPDELMRQLFETNVFGVVRMLRAVLPGMREQRSGAIVNVSSVSGRVPSGYSGLYPASKHALEAMTEGLAIEVRPFGIRVHLVEPGFFQTAILANGLALGDQAPDSPYAVEEAATNLFYTQGIGNGGDATVVAEAIVHAATSEPPVLRHLVGADAEMWVQGREALDDDRWAALCVDTLAPFVAQVRESQGESATTS